MARARLRPRGRLEPPPLAPELPPGVLRDLLDPDKAVLIPTEPYLRAVRQVLGVIDLDPCSSPRAQVAIDAVGWFRADHATAALAEEWSGRVFLHLHPSRRIGRFQVQKLLRDWLAGRVSAAVLLLAGSDWLRLEPLLLSFPFVLHSAKLAHWKWEPAAEELLRAWPPWYPLTVGLPRRSGGDFDPAWLADFRAAFRDFGRVALTEDQDDSWQQDVLRTTWRWKTRPLLTHARIDRHGNPL